MSVLGRSTSILALLVICVIAGAAANASAATVAPAAKPPRVSLQVPSKLGSKGRVHAKGTVAPAPPRGRVVLQFRDRESWRALGHGALRRGRFRIAAKLPARVTATRLRAALFEGKRLVATSSTHAVRVRRIDSQPPPAAPGPGSPTPTPPSHQPAADPLAAPSLLATIDRYASLPNHLSSTANSAAVLDEFRRQLGEAGLELGQQAFTYPEFVPTGVGLTAGAVTVPAAAIAPLLYSGVTGPAGVSGQLFDGGNGTYDSTEVAGKIVVVSTAYQTNSKALNFYPAIESAVEGGAVGMVAVTQAVGDYPKWEDVNARNGTGPLPVVTVGKRTGAAVIAAAKAGEAGNLTLTARTGTACDRDVWGELPGADPERRVFIATPASSFTPSASEHGTAYAIVLGLARHYAALPKSERPATLVFMALGGHEIGWLGLQALMASPQGSWFTNADAYVHLGSGLGVATSKEEADGRIVTTPAPDPTGRLHESENPLLEQSILDDWAAAGVPTPETPPHTASGGEQTYAYAAGIPTVSFSGASLYFHTAGDLPSVVDPSILTKQADAFRRSVDTITGLPAGALRAANGHAEELGKGIDAAARAPYNATLGAGGTLGSGGIGGPTATAVAACP